MTSTLEINLLNPRADVSRRDRIAYAGDLDIETALSIARININKYVNGSIELMASCSVLRFFVHQGLLVQLLTLLIKLGCRLHAGAYFSFCLDLYFPVKQLPLTNI